MIKMNYLKFKNMKMYKVRRTQLKNRMKKYLNQNLKIEKSNKSKKMEMKYMVKIIRSSRSKKVSKLSRKIKRTFKII